MSILVPVYRDLIMVMSTFGLSGLAVDASATSGDLDNRTIRATDIRLRLDVSVLAYVSGSSVDLYMASSLGDSSYTHNQNTLLASILVPTTGNPIIWEGSILDAVPSLPAVMRFTVVNKCSGAFSAAYAHSLVALPINFEYA